MSLIINRRKLLFGAAAMAAFAALPHSASASGSTLIGILHTGDSIAAIEYSYFYQALGYANSIGDAGYPLRQASATYYSTATSVPIIGRNMAISGTGLIGASPQLQGIVSTYGAALIPVGYSVPPFDAPRQYIIGTAIGHNDDAIASYATVQDYAAAVAATLQISGFNLAYMCTLLPSTAVLSETNRLLYNSTIMGAGWAAANGIAYIIDLASQAIMGNPANCTNTTYYLDGTHPTMLGFFLLAPIYLAGVNFLIGLL